MNSDFQEVNDNLLFKDTASHLPEQYQDHTSFHWACPSLLLSAFSLVSQRWVPPHNSIFWVILILQGSAKQQFIRLQSIPAFISHVHLRNCKETEAALLFIYWCEHNNHSWTKLNLLLEGAQRLSEDSKFSPQTCKLKLRRAVMPLQTFTHLLKQLNLTYKKIKHLTEPILGSIILVLR